METYTFPNWAAFAIHTAIVPRNSRNFKTSAAVKCTFVCTAAVSEKYKFTIFIILTQIPAMSNGFFSTFYTKRKSAPKSGRENFQMIRCKGSDRIVSASLAAEAAKLAQKLPDAAEIKTHGFFLLGRCMSLEDRSIVIDLFPFCNPQILEAAERSEKCLFFTQKAQFIPSIRLLSRQTRQLHE